MCGKKTCLLAAGTPSKYSLRSASAAAPEPYCCGVPSCTVPVPPPPAELPPSAAQRAANLPQQLLTQYAAARRTYEDTWNVLPEQQQQQQTNQPGKVKLSLCGANPRTPVPSFTGLASNAPWLVLYWADTRPNTTCPWTQHHLLLTGCTGNQLAPHLVLTAAHCVDVAHKQQAKKCEGLSLVRIVLCYSFDRSSWECRDSAVEAVGVSWHPYPSTGSPYDQAVVFTQAARAGPYFRVGRVEHC